MKTDNVFSVIDDLAAEYVAVWEDVCNLESPSSDKQGVDAVCAYFIKLSEKFGWKVEVYLQERFGDPVCITMNPEVKKAPIALSGHVDTVHPVGSFGFPAARRDGDRLYGPGAVDCKGGIVAGFLAMHALHEVGYKDRPVMMLLQTNEEIGSGIDNKAPIQYICEKAKNAVAFLNLEGHEVCFASKACVKRKGIAGFQFTVTGVSVHAAKCAKEGANALAEAAYKIIELEKIKQDGGLTFSCNMISAGTSRNTVPDRCEFQVDVRYATAEEFDEAKRLVEEIANKVHVEGCRCGATLTNMRMAMEPNEKNMALLERANAAFEENGLSILEAGMCNGGSDAADISDYGIPCLDSLGVGGERIHTTEEFGLIRSLVDSAKRLAAIISSL